MAKIQSSSLWHRLAVRSGIIYSWGWQDVVCYHLKCVVKSADTLLIFPKWILLCFFAACIIYFFSMYGGIHVIPGFSSKSTKSTSDQHGEVKQHDGWPTDWAENKSHRWSQFDYVHVFIIIPYLRWPAFVLFQPQVFKQLVNKSNFFHPINNWDYPPDYPVLHSSLSRPDQVEIVTADFDRHLCKGKHNNRVFVFWGFFLWGGGGGTLVFWPLSSKAQIIIGKIRWGKKILKRKNNFRF